MEDPFDHMGRWWISGRKDTPLTGVLHIPPQATPVLRVMGEFHSGEPSVYSDIDIINGTTPACNKITLFDCHTRGFGGMHEGWTEYEVNLAILGEHFASPSDIQFKQVDVSYSTLVDWVSSPVFDYPLGTGYGPIRLREPLVLNLFSSDRMRIVLIHGSVVNTELLGRSISVTSRSRLRFSFDGPRPFSQVADAISTFRDFLTFATSTATGIDEVNSGSSPGETISIHLGRFVNPRQQEEPRFPLFALCDFQQSIQTVLVNWFGKTPDLRVVIDLYLATRYHEMDGEARLFSLIQALEAFHRRFRANEELPKDQHEARIASILSSAPKEHSSWLGWKMKYGNEPNLRTRLERLFTEFHEVTSRFRIEPKKVVEDASNTRNYLAHHDQSLANKAVQGEGFYQLNDSLELLLDCCLLGELGVPCSTICELVSHKHLIILKDPE